MTISRRTPEGNPSLCPLCTDVEGIEVSASGNNATCSRCGHQLTISNQVVQLLTNSFADTLNIEDGNLNGNSSFSDLGADSLDSVELVMGIEDEFGISIPDGVAERLKTVGDVVEFIETSKVEA